MCAPGPVPTVPGNGSEFKPPNAQPVTATLEMTGMDRRTVRDLFGGHEFPAVDEAGSLTLTLGGHGVYWLKVRPLDAHGEPMTTTTALPVIAAD